MIFEGFSQFFLEKMKGEKMLDCIKLISPSSIFAMRACSLSIIISFQFRAIRRLHFIQVVVDDGLRKGGGRFHSFQMSKKEGNYQAIFHSFRSLQKSCKNGVAQFLI